MSGYFITFEGGEGSGKSTQIELLRGAFEKKKRPCLVTREPGGTKEAETIRSLLVQKDGGEWNALAETLLFYAARAQHVGQLVKPALAEGKTVLCDRFADSTLVYQGIAKGLSAEFVRNLHGLTLGNFMPDLTFILDIDPAIGLSRAGRRAHSETRFESLGHDFHHRIRAGFLSVAGREKQRCAVIDAAPEAAKVHQAIIDTINERFDLGLKAAA